VKTESTGFLDQRHNHSATSSKLSETRKIESCTYTMHLMPCILQSTVSCPSMDVNSVQRPSSRIILHTQEDYKPSMHCKHNRDELHSEYTIKKRYKTDSRKEKVYWSPEETIALLKGVEEFGTSNWKAILDKYKNVFHSDRKHSNLFDKYRTMNNKTSYYRVKNKPFVYANENGEDIHNASGERVVYSSKFPSDVAKTIARKVLSKESDSCSIHLKQEENSEVVIHTYHASLNNGRVCIRKTSSAILQTPQNIVNESR